MIFLIVFHRMTSEDQEMQEMDLDMTACVFLLPHLLREKAEFFYIVVDVSICVFA